MSFLGKVGKAVGSVLGAVTSGSGGLPGTIISAGLGYLGQERANRTNEDIAAANNATSIDLYGRKYQLAVKDLSAAGLNPIMAYGSTPSNPPPLQQSRVENSAESAMRASVAGAQTKLLESQIANTG